MTLHMYADENDRQFPWSGGGNNAACLLYFFPRYGLTEESFICPSDQNNGLRGRDPNKPTPINARLDRQMSLRASYDYFGAYTNAPLNLPPVQSVGFPRVPMMWDKGSAFVSSFNHVPGGSNVLWMDGSVDFVKAAEFASVNLPYAPKDIAYLRPEGAPAETMSDDKADVVKKTDNPPPSRWSTSIPVPPPVRIPDPEELSFLRKARH